MRPGFMLFSALLALAAPAAVCAEAAAVLVRSADGTPIAVECSGAGPTLLIVHGGTGNRGRWKPLVPRFAKHFTVCAMDRRGHGESGDHPVHSLRKEAQDVAAVVKSRGGNVFVLGHSYGAVAALEAAFLTRKITRLVLYEPPLQERDHSEAASQMDALLRDGKREEATITFMQDVVLLPPSEVEAMRSRPSWPALVASIGTSPRQLRALAAYRFDPKRMAKLKMPTLILAGGATTSPELRQAARSLDDAMPHAWLFIFDGQQHNAMDTVPDLFADTVTSFLLENGAPAGKQ